LAYLLLIKSRVRRFQPERREGPTPVIGQVVSVTAARHFAARIVSVTPAGQAKDGADLDMVLAVPMTEDQKRD
jgi:hypothetical protein